MDEEVKNDNAPRARGHLIEIGDGMFGWYEMLGQPLASMKMPLLSVPSGGQGYRSRSKVKCVHFLKKKQWKDVPFQPFII